MTSLRRRRARIVSPVDPAQEQRLSENEAVADVHEQARSKAAGDDEDGCAIGAKSDPEREQDNGKEGFEKDLGARAVERVFPA